MRHPYRRHRRGSTRSLALAVTLGAGIIACARGAGSPPAAPSMMPIQRAITWEETLRLASSRDYFTLRDRVLATGEDRSPPARFARALVQHAFNEPAASNATIAALLAERSLPDTLAADLRLVQLSNHLRLFEYAAGAAASGALLADTAALDPMERRDARNMERLFRALAGAPPQTVARRGPITLPMEQGHLPVQVNDSSRHYVFDTGANLSTMMRSEAAAVGVRIIPAGIDVGTSTDLRVTADVGVADRLAVGGMDYRHVPFLVLDDSLLAFPGGFRIPGIIGFPVIEPMGEIQLRTAGELVVPLEVPARPQRNLALHELTPLIRVHWGGTPLLCMLDTGADATRLYEPFYRRFRARIDTASTPATRRLGGAGGVSELPVRVLRDVELAVGDTVVALDSLDVLTRSIARSAADAYLDCAVGQDVLRAFSGYVLNFREMGFVLR